jgi:hypothetical protein
MRLNVFQAICIILLLTVSFAQQKSHAIKLAAIIDNQEILIPDEVTIISNNHPIILKVENGIINVPSEIAISDKIALVMDLAKDHIQFSDIPRTALQSEFWTLYLAEKRYSEDFQFAVPEGTDISKSCIIAFRSLNHEGFFCTARLCRSPK